MTIEEIVLGESKNVEFKEKLPQNSEKYTKTVIGFANTQGGQLIIGIEDGTRKVTGVDNDSVFQVMDNIANTVSDSCTPQIVPDIAFQTIEGKTVVVASVAPGANRPYYLKSKGKENGTYIRVGGTTRLADAEKIRELEYEGARISWDEQICVGYTVTEKAIKKLCQDMNRYRKEMLEGKEGAEKLPRVTRAQLLNWNVLKKSGENYLATNAFALLTGTHFHYSRTQCAVFAGTERGDFIDKQEYAGPLYKQIEEAYSFVMRNMRRSARVDGLVRKEKYELPLSAVREMIINAHCHRNFLDSSCVQVALYDDRLEVTSPGNLCYGLTLEEAMSGRSKQRNRVIAEVFNQMGLIEAWGTGLGKIQRAAREYHLPEPEFIEMPETFRVNLFRNPPLKKNLYYTETHSDELQENFGETSEKLRKNFGETTEELRSNTEKELSQTQKKILELLSINEQFSAGELANQIGVSRRSIESNIKILKEKGFIIRHGPPKGGYWEVIK